MSMGKLELTTVCNDVLSHSQNVAREFNHKYVTTEHVFLALIEKTNTASTALSPQDVNIEDIRKAIIRDISKKIPKADEGSNMAPQYSPKVSRAVTYAGIAAKRCGSPVIGVSHLLIGILEDDSGLVPDILSDCGVDIAVLQDDVIGDALPTKTLYSPEDASNDVTYAGETIDADTYTKKSRSKRKSGSKSLLDTYAIDLTTQAAEGKLDPVLGREYEIDEMIQVLMRRQKNNPMIVGESGVGKTALVEGLAQRIINREVPERLVSATIYSIDMGSVLSGTKYRGQFEERLKGIIEELNERQDCIAFIDEFHTVIGSGNSEGSLDAANILKPALSRGQITVIGATTYDEYRVYIEADSALSRRFQKIDIGEPSTEYTLDILKGIKKPYEKHHNVKYSIESLNAIINLSQKYITDRNFPDKAIDLLDQAGAKSRSQLLSSDAFDVNLENRINQCTKSKDKCVKDKDFEEAAKLKLEQDKLEELYEQNFIEYDKQLRKKITIRQTHIEQLVAQYTGIPCEKLDDNSIGKLKTITKFLNKKVIGQEKAIDIVCKSIKRSRAGISDEKCPIGTFLFLGPTGVGKTHLAKGLTEFMFGDEDAMIRLDMSEYMEAHSVSKLIGSPPGYVGYDDGGKLTEAVRRKPYSVILLDEIEKAHDDVYNLLLQLLDEGKLTDSHGVEVNFKNCVIIMTSNIGAERIQKNNTMGFLGTAYNDVEEKVMLEVEKSFKPEFINRIDEIAVFNHLEEDSQLIIVDQLLKELVTRLRSRKIRLSIDKDVKQFILDEGYDQKFGARPLKRAIKNHIESPLADYIIDADVKSGTSVKVSLDGDKIKCTKRSTTNSTKKRTSNSA